MQLPYPKKREIFHSYQQAIYRCRMSFVSVPALRATFLIMQVQNISDI